MEAITTQACNAVIKWAYIFKFCLLLLSLSPKPSLCNRPSQAARIFFVLTPSSSTLLRKYLDSPDSSNRKCATLVFLFFSFSLATLFLSPIGSSVAEELLYYFISCSQFFSVTDDFMVNRVNGVFVMYEGSPQTKFKLPFLSSPGAGNGKWIHDVSLSRPLSFFFFFCRSQRLTLPLHAFRTPRFLRRANFPLGPKFLRPLWSMGIASR